ncbi:hypothetical protein ACHQM5_009227 [Ranunculus cassubicifolius]
MAGRNRGPRYPLSNDSRVFRDVPRALPMSSHPARLEDEIQIHREENRRLVSENRHLADETVILRRELVATKDEIQRLDQIIPQVRADKELHARELIQNGLKLESQLRDFEPLKVESLQLRAEFEKLNASRQELSAKVQSLTKDLTRLQTENKQLPLLGIDIDGLRQELTRARMAFEYEKKANLELMERKQAMEKNINSMGHELEKLQAENARGYGGAYGALKGMSDLGYTGSAYGDSYAGNWSAYDTRGPPRP